MVRKLHPSYQHPGKESLKTSSFSRSPQQNQPIESTVTEEVNTQVRKKLITHFFSIIIQRIAGGQ